MHKCLVYRQHNAYMLDHFCSYISLPLFLLGLVVGLLGVYLNDNEAKPVFVYPSPENYSRLQFQDVSGQCFEIQPTPMPKCPLNPFSVRTVPLQKGE